MSNHNKPQHEDPPVIVLAKRKITVFIDDLDSLDKPFTSQDTVMGNLGLDRERLIGETVRYSLIHGKNTNFVEVEAPVDVIQSNLGLVIGEIADDDTDPQVAQAADKFFDKALEITADKILETHQIISELDPVIKMHDKIQNDYGNKYELDLESVKRDNDMGRIRIDLTLTSELETGTDPLQV